MSAADVWGSEDLNNRLEQFPQIQLQHHKLWLTSVHLLAKLPAATAFLDAAQAVESMRHKFERYVPNPSFNRAMQILENQRVCIIVGNPGVGKTTLAEALLITHVKSEFQPVRILSSLVELKGVTDSNQRQIFYFDDFLGPTGLDRGRHHEQNELVRILEQVERTPNWRFVLTTRDYILHAAGDRSDRLHEYLTDRETCAIRQETYTAPLRAEILYNHLYFSGLSDAFKLEMVEGRQYMNIVNHPNYNPRIIAFMTNPRHTASIPPGGYAAAFRAALDDPSRIWDKAFRRDISTPARHVLLALLTLPDIASLEELELAFDALHRVRSPRDGIESRPDDFRSALKELAGNFIAIERAVDAFKVRFDNPSVRDYLERYVVDVPREAVDLIGVATTTRQLRRLWSGRAGQVFPGLLRAGKHFVEQSLVVTAREMEAERTRRNKKLLPTPEQRRTPEDRVQLAIALSERIPGPETQRLLRLTLKGFIRALTPTEIELDAPMRVLKATMRRTENFSYRRTLLCGTKLLLLKEMLDLEGAERAAEFAWNYSSEITYQDRALAKKQLEEIAELIYWRVSAWDSAQEIEDRCERLEDAASRFSVSIEWRLEQLRVLGEERKANPPAEPKDSGPTLFDLLEMPSTPVKDDSMAAIDASFLSLGTHLSGPSDLNEDL